MVSKSEKIMINMADTGYIYETEEQGKTIMNSLWWAIWWANTSVS